jgi:hypothetical protein
MNPARAAGSQTAPALTLGQTQKLQSPEYSCDKGAALVFIGRDGEADIGSAPHQFPGLLDRIEP